MSSLTLISMSWRNLMRRKSRTFLTIFSVIIGAVAIIMMLSFGYAMEENSKKQMESFMQLTSITVQPRYYGGDNMDGSSGNSSKGRITDKEVEKIKELDHVSAVLPCQYVEYDLQLKDNRYMLWGGGTMAIDFSLLNDKNVTIDKGRLPKKGRKDEVLISSSVSVMKMDKKNQGMPEPADVDILKEKMILISYNTGQGDINIGNNKLSLEMETVGTFSASQILQPRATYISFESLDKMKEKERKAMQSADPSQQGDPGILEGPKGPMDRRGYLPARPDSPSLGANRGGKNIRYYDTVIVQVDDLKYANDLVDTIQDELKLEAYANTDFIEEQAKAMRTVQLIFGGLGSIALFVAAIGIANTMLMSIQERIKEIGVMKVIGAQVKDIRRIFLFEAMLIGVIGGIIGVIISYGLSFAVNHYAQSLFENSDYMPGDIIVSFIPLWLPFASFVFSALIGLISGYLPARRATRVSAIEAIRSN